MSVDESEQWADNTRNLLQVRLGERDIAVITRPRIARVTADPVQFKYEAQFNESYDFVLVDGPSHQVNGKKYKDAIDADVFELPVTGSMTSRATRGGSPHRPLFGLPVC